MTPCLTVIHLKSNSNLTCLKIFAVFISTKHFSKKNRQVLNRYTILKNVKLSVQKLPAEIMAEEVSRSSRRCLRWSSAAPGCCPRRSSAPRAPARPGRARGTCSRPPAGHLGRGGGSKIGKILQIFGGLVLGCIKTKFCKKICV